MIRSAWNARAVWSGILAWGVGVAAVASGQEQGPNPPIPEGPALASTGASSPATAQPTAQALTATPQASPQVSGSGRQAVCDACGKADCPGGCGPALKTALFGLGKPGQVLPLPHGYTIMVPALPPPRPRRGPSQSPSLLSRGDTSTLTMTSATSTSRATNTTTRSTSSSGDGSSMTTSSPTSAASSAGRARLRTTAGSWASRTTTISSANESTSTPGFMRRFASTARFTGQTVRGRRSRPCRSTSTTATSTTSSASCGSASTSKTRAGCHSGTAGTRSFSSAISGWSRPSTGPMRGGRST